jgi:polyphosphate glucokinase
MEILGIDVGGSAVKGALVNLETGEFVSQRVRFPTEENVKPEKMAELIDAIITQLEYDGPVGCGFPAPIKGGVACLAENVSHDWIGMNLDEFFQQKTGKIFYVLNDADSAGYAEMHFGAGKDWQKGVVLLITIGTGIGSAIFVDGVLLPNTEFGHLKIRGKLAEKRASDAARQKKEMSWEKWAKHLQEYLDEMESLISPDLIIVGGGVSKKYDEFLPLLKLDAIIVPAELQNKAGIVGAALYAGKRSG